MLSAAAQRRAIVGESASASSRLPLALCLTDAWESPPARQRQRQAAFKSTGEDEAGGRIDHRRTTHQTGARGVAFLTLVVRLLVCCQACEIGSRRDFSSESPSAAASGPEPARRVTRSCDRRRHKRMRLTGGISHTYPAPWVVRDDDSSAQPPRELVHHKSLVRRGEDAAPPSTAALRAPPAISLGHLAASLHHQQAQSNALLHHLHARVDATSGELTLASSTLAAVQNRLAQRIDELERTTVAMQQTQQHQERTLGVHRAQVERRQETTSQQIERIQRRLAMPVTDVPPVAEPTLLPPVVPFVPSGSIAQPLQPPSDASPAHQQRFVVHPPPSRVEASEGDGALLLVSLTCGLDLLLCWQAALSLRSGMCAWSIGVLG